MHASSKKNRSVSLQPLSHMHLASTASRKQPHNSPEPKEKYQCIHINSKMYSRCRDYALKNTYCYCSNSHQQLICNSPQRVTLSIGCYITQTPREHSDKAICQLERQIKPYKKNVLAAKCCVPEFFFKSRQRIWSCAKIKTFDQVSTLWLNRPSYLKLPISPRIPTLFREYHHRKPNKSRILIVYCFFR